MEHELFDLRLAFRELEHRHSLLLDSMLTTPTSVWAVVVKADNTTAAGFLNVTRTVGKSRVVLNMHTLETCESGNAIEYVLPNMPNAWTMQYVQPVQDAHNYHSMVIVNLHDGQSCSILFCTEFDRAKFDHMMRNAF